jgi:hypothetical protein
MLYMDAELVSARRRHLHVPVGDTFLHIQAAVEAVDIPACQIEFLIDEAQVDAAPVGSLGYTGVIRWKSVLPPSYAGFVQESDAGHK